MKYVMTAIAVLSFASFANAHDDIYYHSKEFPDDWSYQECMEEAESHDWRWRREHIRLYHCQPVLRDNQ